MIRIKLNESNTLQFEMIVEGNAKKIEKTWIVLEANGFELRFPAVHQNNQVSCSIPPLAGILPNGQTTAHLDVIIDGRYYRPLSETVTVGSGRADISIIAKDGKSSESFAALKKISEQNTALSTIDLSGFAKQLEEKLAEEQALHEQRLAEARKIADILVGGINNSVTDLESVELLRKRLSGK